MGAGLGGGGGANPLAQAQEMLAKAQQELAEAEVEGTAGGGAVRVTMSGDQKIMGIKLEPEVELTRPARRATSTTADDTADSAPTFSEQVCRLATNESDSSSKPCSDSSHNGQSAT